MRASALEVNAAAYSGAVAGLARPPLPLELFVGDLFAWLCLALLKYPDSAHERLSCEYTNPESALLFALNKGL